MLARLHLAALFTMTSLALFACGGHTGEAKGPESDPWAGYKGTYATPANASGSSSARLKAGQAAAKEEAAAAAPAEVAEEAPAPEPVAAPPPAAKGKKAKGAPASAVTKAAPKKKK